MARLAVVGLALALAACAESAPPPAVLPGGAPDECAGTSCREARSLRLYIDDTHVWESALPPTPYVRKDVVSVFPGDDFWLAAEEAGGQLVNLRAVPAPTGPPENVLHVRLRQEKLDAKATGGARVMFLVINNFFAGPLVYKALTHDYRQAKGRFAGASTCPLRPKLEVIEIWPDPLTALMLRDFRFDERSTVCKEY